MKVSSYLSTLRTIQNNECEHALYTVRKYLSKIMNDLDKKKQYGFKL